MVTTLVTPPTVHGPALLQVGRYGSALKFREESGLSIERNGVFEWSSDDSFFKDRVPILPAIDVARTLSLANLLPVPAARNEVSGC